MHRTTIALKDDLYRKLFELAQGDNRTTNNLIETILMRYLEDEFYADEFEMEEIRRDPSLKKAILKGLADYKAGRGKFC